MKPSGTIITLKKYLTFYQNGLNPYTLSVNKNNVDLWQINTWPINCAKCIEILAKPLLFNLVFVSVTNLKGP